MTYSAEISRANPTCFLFLIDQSGSMAQSFGPESTKTKAQGVSDAINRLLQTLIERCTKGTYILDRYFIGSIGYGGADIGLGFPVEALAGSVLQPVSAIANHPLRIEDRMRRIDDGAGGLIEQRIRFPIWFEPKAGGKTPMCAAINAAYQVVSGFVTQYPGCFPPIVFNITDGMATDGNPEPLAGQMMSLCSFDGNALFFNIHIAATGGVPIVFPNDERYLADDFARMLFRMSSPLPPEMLRQAQILETPVAENARGFAYQADLSLVISFLDIGTRVASNFNDQRLR